MPHMSRYNGCVLISLLPVRLNTTQPLSAENLHDKPSHVDQYELFMRNIDQTATKTLRHRQIDRNFG